MALSLKQQAGELATITTVAAITTSSGETHCSDIATKVRRRCAPTRSPAFVFEHDLTAIHRACRWFGQVKWMRTQGAFFDITDWENTPFTPEDVLSRFDEITDWTDAVFPDDVKVCAAVYSCEWQENKGARCGG